MPKAEPEPN